MNWSNVKLIFKREVRDQLRDRRTLFVIVVLPLMLYPLIGMLFLQVSQFLKQHASRVLIVTHGELPTQPPLIQQDRLARNLVADDRLIDIEVRKIEPTDVDHVRKMAMSMIDEERYDTVVYFPDELTRAINAATRQWTSAPTPDHVDAGTSSEFPEPVVFLNTAKDKSRIAHDRITAALAQWRSRIVDRTLSKHQLPPRVATPFHIATRDLAAPVRRRAALWSKILPFAALIWAMTGAFYPAIDLCAGEKERGTLETLLSSPAERIEIVWGKLLTVMLFSIATAVLNLVFMGFTAIFVFSQFESALAHSETFDFGPPPFSTLLWLIPALIPISALFSAISLALATMARSSKEGQYYLMPVLLITFPLMMLPMLPSVELDLGNSLIPLTGVVLLLRQLMEGEYREALLYAIPVIGVTAACCWFGIRWAVDQFNNETVLFRESERFDLQLWVLHLFRDRGPTPSAAEAVMCGLIILLIRFFAGTITTPPGTWNGFVVVMAVTLIAFVAAPALLMSVMLTTSPRQTLSLCRSTRWALSAAVLLAVCLHPVALGITTLIRYLYPIDIAALEPLAAIINQAPNMVSLLLLMAVLPAICEELAFRGFILSGLRHLGSKWRAIAIASLFFGLTHGILQQSIVATMFGLVLGYLAVQTGSLIPCIAFHMVHNSLSILSAHWIPAFLENWPGVSWLIVDVTESTVPNGAMYIYNWPIMLVAIVLSGFLLRWFQMLPCQSSAEERLHTALDHQAIGVATR